LNKYSKSDITQFTKKLIKANNALWNALMLCENLVLDDMFLDLNGITGDENVLKLIAERFTKLSDYESFADTEICGSYLQDFDSFACKISDKIN
jgi:hypothetical protein